MGTYSKIVLSGSTDGQGISVTGTVALAPTRCLSVSKVGGNEELTPLRASARLLIIWVSLNTITS